ncbi:MAG: CBS domain-containing protein [Acidobacteriaceae bacterium]|nr:CBS domain-containing protein [Acidobacteriaceae bacterium]
MRGWSFPLGRVLGVEVRIHTFFVLLLGLSIAESNAVGGSAMRGVALWLGLLLAIAVRETARALTAAYYGMDLRGVLLLPIGGLLAFSTGSRDDSASAQRAEKSIAMVGPAANFACALLIAGLIYGATSQLNVLERPLMTAMHLERSLLWLQVALGAIHLLPAYPLDAGRILRAELARTKGSAAATRTAGGVGMLLALALIAAGIVFFQSAWVVMAGFFVLMGGQMEEQGHVLQSVVDTVKMRDIMLTDFSTLSASDTFEDAVRRSVHTLQENFPVVRGNTVVGVVSRAGILDALNREGNGYVQGIMQRGFQAAQLDDTLGKVFRNMTTGPAMELVPVIDGKRVVGIVTLQNLKQSIGLFAETQRVRSEEE